MIIPILCFTCNNVVAHLWEAYLAKIQIAYIDEDIANFKKKRFVDIEQLATKTVEGKILDELGLNRYCCRRNLITNIDMMDVI